MGQHTPIHTFRFALQSNFAINKVFSCLGDGAPEPVGGFLECETDLSSLSPSDTASMPCVTEISSEAAADRKCACSCARSGKGPQWKKDLVRIGGVFMLLDFTLQVRIDVCLQASLSWYGPGTET